MSVTNRGVFAAALAAVLAASLLSAQPAEDLPRGPTILELQVVEGEGAIHPAGRRSKQPIIVQVSDETGKPVEGVAVSFRMPTSGPKGKFASGLETDVLITGANGRVAVAGISWGETTGTARIRITAVRGEARAGTISEQYVGAPETASGAISVPEGPSVSKPRGKWLTFTLIAAGAVAGGLAIGLSSGGAPAAGGAVAPAAQTTPTVEVGAPVITIGGP